MKRLFLLAFLFHLMFLSGFVLAQTKGEKETSLPDNESLLKIGGEFRLRSETLVHFDSFIPVRSATGDDSFVLLRLRPFFESTPIHEVHLFVQPQFSRTFAQEESTLANITNVDDLDLHQGYVDFQHLAGDHLSFRLGRQELVYGDERLVGAFGWSNVGRSFDAGKITLSGEKFWVDGFASWIQRGGGNQYFGGIYGHWEALAQTTVNFDTVVKH